MTARRTVALAATLALGAGALAGCGDDAPQGAEPPAPRWTAASDPVDTGGLVWASGSTVHLGDGATIDLGEAPAEYVVAGDGAYFTTEAVVDDDGAALEARGLYAADREGPARQVEEGVATPHASPDGRYLVFLDVLSGAEQDRYGTTQVETVVVDLRAGEEVVRSVEGMGDPGSDDLADLYQESEVGVRRVTADTAYVGTTEGDYAFDLATGDAERLDPADRTWDRRPGDLTSPDGRWRITASPQLQDRLVSSTGERVTPQAGAPRWDLEHWTPDGLAVGFAIRGPGRGDQVGEGNSFALMGCAVPSGRCEVVEETTGETISFPVGQAAYQSTTLTPGP